MKTHGSWLHKVIPLTIIVFTCILYLGLGKDYLFEWDEAIYAQLGVELRNNLDFLTPHWNRELWLEKPPAISWVTALGQSITPNLTLGSRLLMPLFAAATLFAVFQIGTILGGPHIGAISMAILGYFNLFLSRSRVVNTDGMLISSISWLVYLLLKGSSPWKIGLVAALAIFAKGPAGFLAILISLPLLLGKSPKYILHTTLYFCLAVIPWHLYQFFEHGSSFYTPYFLEQVVRRATVPIEFHLESRWFYFASLYKDLGLGVILVTVLGLFLASYYFIQTKSKTYLSIITWAILPLIIFTLAKTRLSWYILPSYPGIAILIGIAINSLSYNKLSRNMLNILLIGMLVQMLFHALNYVNPSQISSPLPDHIRIAQLVKKYPGNSLAYLVNSSERVAEAILPPEQKISSSFRYGGAPSVVFYSEKQVRYYYNYDLFRQDLISNSELTLAVVENSDIDKLPSGYINVDSAGSLLLLQRKELYADR